MDIRGQPSSGSDRLFGQLGSTLPRRILLLALLAAGAYLLVPQVVGMHDTVALLRQASLWPLAGSLLCQVGSVLSQSYVAYRLMSSLGPGLGFGRALQIMLSSSLATLLIPSAGVSGLVVRARYLGELGFPTDVTLLGYYLETLAQGIGQSIVVSGALFAGALHGRADLLRPLVVLFGGVLLGGAALALLLSRPREGDWRHAALERLNAVLVRLRRKPLTVQHLEQRLHKVRSALASLGRMDQLRLLVGGTTRVLASALSLQLALQACGQSVPLRTTIIAFSISDVLGYLSTLPGGLVVIETSLLALLASLGVPLAGATAATLIYRLFSLWLPRSLGALTWFNLQRKSSKPFW